MRYGAFETVREVNQGGATAIYSARRAGETGEPRFAVKVLQAPAFWDEREVRQLVGDFLKAAKLQKQLSEASGGSARWAPVHDDPQEVAGGAFYASDLYPSSAEDLSSGRRGAIDQAALWRIADAVIGALRELDEVAARPHGNLKPTNVLIWGHREQLRAVVSDPLPDDAAARQSGLEGDLRSLGRIIYGLVMHGPAPQAGAIDDGPQWKQLGGKGQEWLEFCERLLGRTEAFSTLEDVSQALVNLRPPRTISTRKLWVIAGSSAGALAIVLVVWQVAVARTLDQSKWRELCQEWQLFKNVSAQEALDQLRASSSAHWQHVAKDSEDQLHGKLFRDPWQIANSPESRLDELASMPTNGFNYNSVRAAKESLQFVRKLREEFEAGHDELTPKDVTDWPAIAKDVDRAFHELEDEKPKNGVADDLRTIESAAGHVRDLKTATADATGLKSVHDPLSDLLAARIQALRDQKPPNYRELEQFHPIAADLLQVTDKDYDRKLLSEQLSPQHLKALDTELWSSGWGSEIKLWLNAAKGYERLKPGEDSRHAAEWAAALKSAEEGLGELESRGTKATDEAKNLAQRRGQIVATVGELDRLPAIQKNLTVLTQGSKTVESQLSQLTADIAAAQRRYTVDWNQWLNSPLKPPVLTSGSKALLSLWDSNSRQLLASFPKTDAARYDRRDQIDELRRAIEKIDAESAPPFKVSVAELADGGTLPDWAAALEDVARNEREAAFPAALQWAGTHWQSPGSMDLAINTWNTKLQQFHQFASQLSEFLRLVSAPGGMYGPQDPLPGGGTFESRFSLLIAPPWHLTDPRIKAPVQVVKDLMKLSSEPQVRESALAKPDPRYAGLVLAAWQISKDRTLEQEQQLLDSSLNNWVLQVRDAARRNMLVQKVEVFEQARWEARMSHPGDFNEVKAGEALKTPWKIKVPTNPRVAYHERLYQFVDASRNANWNESEAKDKAQEFFDSIPADAKSQRTVKDFADKLQNVLATAKKWGTKSHELTGPEPHKDWNTVAFGQKVSMGIEGLPGFTFEFQPVDLANGDTVYIATTEASVELVATILQKDSPQIAELKARLKKRSDRQKDYPVIWMCDGQTVSPVLYDWMPAVPGGGGPGGVLAQLQQPFPAWDQARPTPGHPVQNIPFDLVKDLAKVIGCRVPTAAEWKAALEQESRVPAKQPPLWNLRDRAWTLQKQYFLKNRVGFQPRPGLDPAKWGMFTFGDLGRNDNIWTAALKGGLPIRSSIQENPHLLFDTVVPGSSENPPPGHLFYHLIGNVAEFVTDTAEGDGANKPFVIGGSVFSSPDLDPAHPYPVPSVKSTFTDVGFRLAFPAQSISVVRWLQAALKDAPPVWNG